MIGILVVLTVLAGLALGLFGRSIVPDLAASAVAGMLLVCTALAHALRSWRLRTVTSWRVVSTLALGLALVDLPLVFWFLVEAGLAHAPARFPWKAPVSFVVVVVAPTMALLLVRHRQLSAGHALPRGRPEAVIWSFRSRGRAVVTIAGALVAVGLLLPLYGGWPPILVAIRCHSVALTKLFLLLGAEPNPVGRRALTPLSVAIDEGDPALVGLLLDRGASPNDPSADVPLLTQAVMRGRPEVVQLLLEKDADPNVPSVFGPILCVAARGGRSEIASLLLAHGADPDQRDAAGCTALASALGVPNLIEALVEAGVDPNAPCGDRNVWLPGQQVTPLMIASALGYDPAVRALLAAGADCSVRSAEGKTALMLATEHGKSEIVRILEEHGAR
jgi:ankyrin repeat protein